MDKKRSVRAISGGCIEKSNNSYGSSKTEFFVNRPTKRRIVILQFIPRRTVNFELSYKEWKNIINFFQMTINKKLFHKNAMGCIKFMIDKNKFIDWRKSILSRFCLFGYFQLGRVAVQMQMEEFVRLRKFCLDANNYLFRPKVKEQFR